MYDFTTSGKKKVKIVYYGMDKNQEEKKFTAELVVTVGIPWTPIEPSKPSRPSHGSGSSSGSSASVQGTWKQDAAGWYFTYTSGAYAADKLSLIHILKAPLAYERLRDFMRASWIAFAKSVI